MMKFKTKKFRQYVISYINEAELDQTLNELYNKNHYVFRTRKKDPVIFDVGALIGESVLFFKDLYPQAKIIAFEPSPRSFLLLKQNVIQNNLSKVQLVKAAVADHAGRMKFYTSRLVTNPWGRGDSLKKSRFNDKVKSKVITVATVRLSNYIKANVDLLKLDIEGAETEIMQEIEPKLSYIDQIIMEFHASVYNPENNFRLIMDVLERNGFETTIFVAKWFLPKFAVNPIQLMLKWAGVREYWMRIYAKRHN